MTDVKGNTARYGSQTGHWRNFAAANDLAGRSEPQAINVGHARDPRPEIPDPPLLGRESVEPYSFRDCTPQTLDPIPFRPAWAGRFLPRLAPNCSRRILEGSPNEDLTQPPLALVPGPVPLTLGARSWSRSNAGELCGQPGPERFPQTPTHPRWWSNRGKGPLTRTSSTLSPSGGEGRGEGAVNHRLNALSYHIPGSKSLWPR